MQSLVNYRQIALEKSFDLLTLAQSEGNYDPPTTEEVWGLRLLLAILVLLTWWSLLED
jgi:hypothetical protein